MFKKRSFTERSDSTISTNSSQDYHDRLTDLGNVDEMQGGSFCGLTIGSGIQLILSIIAAYLNWSCLQNQSIFIKVITTAMSFFFAIYYLIFYVISKIILGKTC